MKIDLKQLMFDKSLSQRQMADIINTTQSEISNFANGRRLLLRKHIDALIAYFGQETINQYTVSDGPALGQPVEATVTILDPATIEEIKEELAEADSFPILPEEISIKPNIDIREYIAENSSELEYVNPSQMLSRADMAERILRTSMMPTFQPDDIVFVRFIQDKMKIVDGDIYYIDSKNRPTMIRQVKFTEEGKLRLIAQNPQYGDILMDRCDVLNIASIVGLLRMNFSDQYSEIEAVRRKKDEQVDNLIQQMDKAGDRERMLIEHIINSTKR